MINPNRVANKFSHCPFFLAISRTTSEGRVDLGSIKNSLLKIRIKKRKEQELFMAAKVTKDTNILLIENSYRTILIMASRVCKRHDMPSNVD